MLRYFVTLISLLEAVLKKYFYTLCHAMVDADKELRNGTSPALDSDIGISWPIGLQFSNTRITNPSFSTITNRRGIVISSRDYDTRQCHCSECYWEIGFG